MALKNIKLASIIICMCACLLGCSTAPVKVQQAVPEQLARDMETLDIRNCDSNDDMVTTLAAQAPVRQQISVPEQATVLETGSVVDIPNEVHDELRLQVESVYQPELQKAVAGTEEVGFVIPGHKIHMYKIQWIQQIYRSTISFSLNNESCTADYVYTLETPSLDSYTVMACTA